MTDKDDDDFQTAFWAAKHALALASATAFSQHGVHEGQQFVLRSLWAEDGLTPGEIARRLGLSTPTVTRATARMESAGLLRREPHPSDGRMIRLRLTSRGRELEKVIDAEMYQLTERALATFSVAERKALIQALRRIRVNLASVATPVPRGTSLSLTRYQGMHGVRSRATSIARAGNGIIIPARAATAASVIGAADGMSPAFGIIGQAHR